MSRGLAVFFSIFLVLVPVPSHSSEDQAPGEASVRVTVSATTLAVADSLKLVIEASAPENDGLRLPSPTEKLGNFNIARSLTEAQSLSPGPHPMISQKQTLTLQPDLPGVHLIPPLKITTGGGTIATEPVEVTVTSALPALTNGLRPRPHEPALDEHNKQKTVFFLLLALAAASAGWFTYHRRQALCRSARIQDVDLSSAAIASRALDALPAHATAKEIHAVAMAYLTAEFGPQATALTAGDEAAVNRPCLEAYLRSFDQARFSQLPEASATLKLRKALQGLIMEGSAP